MLKTEKSKLAVLAIDEARLKRFAIDAPALSRLYARIEKDIAANMYPGAAVALARHGEIVCAETFGQARLAQLEDGVPAQAADSDTLWLLYSQTKPVTSCALWILTERGMLSLHTPVAFYIPEFARHGKENVTVYHLLTHQSGFPNECVSPDAWSNKELLHQTICDFKLDYEPGSQVSYHSYASHWVQALLIETLTGCDFRDFIKAEILDPLQLHNFFVGVPDSAVGRLAGAYEWAGGEHQRSLDFDKAEFYASGMPGAGGYATAEDLALFYQMLLANGSFRGVRLLSPDMVRYATRNHTGDRPDQFFGSPMHRGLGVHVRGNTPTIRGLGSTASPATFGHGGVGTSYTFADPNSGVSFSYLTNSRLSDPAHSKRLDEIMTMAHAAVNDC